MAKQKLRRGMKVTGAGLSPGMKIKSVVRGKRKFPRREAMLGVDGQLSSGMKVTGKRARVKFPRREVQVGAIEITLTPWERTAMLDHVISKFAETWIESKDDAAAIQLASQWVNLLVKLLPIR